MLDLDFKYKYHTEPDEHGEVSVQDGDTVWKVEVRSGQFWYAITKPIAVVNGEEESEAAKKRLYATHFVYSTPNIVRHARRRLENHLEESGQYWGINRPAELRRVFTELESA